VSTFTVTINYGGYKYQVHGTASPYRPARTNCSNDDATPAEGGIEEISEVYLLDAAGKVIDLPDFLQDELVLHFEDNSDVDERVDEALKDCAESAREDHADKED
jgi:hypothetical protein